MSRPYPRYQDDPRADPFADGPPGSRGQNYDQSYTDRHDSNYDPYDPSSGNAAPHSDIPLQTSQPGDFVNRGYTGLPHNESQTDLSLANPALYSTGAAVHGTGRNSGFTMERGYSNVLLTGESYPSARNNSSSVLNSGPSPWLQHQQKGQRKSKFMIWGAALLVIGLIIIGIVVGVVVSNNKNKNASTSSSNHAVNQTDPNDPSTFVKDSNLHRAFYGLAYTPENSQLPGCGNKLADVIQDIQLISQLTTRIRLYGSDCNQTALVLEAIKRTKVDLQVFIGNYPIPTDGGAAYRRQRDIMKTAIQTYGTDHIAGVTVGNEFMLNYLGANGGGADPNSAVGDTGAALLIADIQDTRDMLASLNLQTTPPVGTSDAGSYFNTKVLSAVDYGLANVHPWFANVTVETAASWTTNFFKEQNVDVAAKLSNNPKMYIAETGWPTKSSDAGNANNGASTASVPNLQTFIDTFVCQANSAGVPYFFFEFSDEPWKDAQFGGVEGWWGLFGTNRKLKDGITIPTCSSP